MSRCRLDLQVLNRRLSRFWPLPDTTIYEFELQMLFSTSILRGVKMRRRLFRELTMLPPNLTIDYNRGRFV